MIPALPQPLQRVHTRLLQRDSLELLRDRIAPRSCFWIASWMARAVDTEHRVRAYAPITAMALARAYAVAAADSEMKAAMTMFGIGLVAGCQIRDEVEGDSPIARAVGWTNALAALEGAPVRSALWSIGLPEDLTTINTLVEALERRVPDTYHQAGLALVMSRNTRVPQQAGFPEIPLLLGLAGAGIRPPRRTPRSHD